MEATVKSPFNPLKKNLVTSKLMTSQVVEWLPLQMPTKVNFGNKRG